MSKITLSCLAATFFAVATPAALSEAAQNSSLSCVDSGEKVQLMVMALPDTSKDPEVLSWEKSAFDDASALCHQTIEELNNAELYGEAGEDNLYLRIEKNAGVYNLCLATIHSDCSRILFELSSSEQISKLEAYLDNNYEEVKATGERGARGSYKVPFFWRKPPSIFNNNR
ncbi:MAG: hypothetical protein F6K21_05855 [Symploca sp. SIO2D2]|nr:hypothetical protein [Symploca sp. SIO2D2]